MSISFRGIPIKCGDRHSWPQLESPALHARRTFYFGSHGNSEIVGGRGSRLILFDMWIADAAFKTSLSVEAYLGGLDRSIGQHGTLVHVIPGGGGQTAFSKCTLDAVSRVPMPGHQGTNIIPTSDLLPGSHWTMIVMAWTQLVLEQ